MKRLTALVALLLAMMMLCSCSAISEYVTEALHGDETETEEEPQEDPQPTVSMEPIAIQTESDRLFGLAWDQEQSFNPLFSESLNNQNLMGLVYEGLFALGEDFSAEKVLCQDFTVSDSLLTYTFTIRSGVKFHNGRTMTAQDVVYSISQAWNSASSVYYSRFHALNAVYAADDSTVVIELGSPYEQLELILDVPIIPEGSADEAAPAGTGPYTLSRSGGLLTAFDGWWQGKELPVEEIHLFDSGTLDELRDDFETSRVDVLSVDPTGTGSLSFHNDYELFEYKTTIMQYIGFNFDSDVFCYPAARQAVCYAIDRDYIVEEIYSDKADAAVLPCQTESRLYDDSLAAKYGFDESRIKECLTDGGFETLEGSDLMYIETSTMMQPCTIDFIVNIENTYKVQTAKYIASILEKNGFSVGLRTLSYDDYLYALNNDDFDMYLAEVKLSPDFDLTRLLNYTGYLNYGSVTIDELNATVRASLENSGAAQDLYAAIYDNGLMAPILFKRYALIAPRGLVKNISPTATDCFHNIAGWTVEFE